MKPLTTLVTAALFYAGACEEKISIPTTMTNQELSASYEEPVKPYEEYDNIKKNNYYNHNSNADYNYDNTEKDSGYLKGPSVLRTGQTGCFTLVNRAGLVDKVPEPPKSTLDSYDRGFWLVSDGSKVEFLDDKDNNQNTFQIRFNHPGEYRVWNKFENYFLTVNVLEK